MTLPTPITMTQALQQTTDQDRSLVLGNGFSIAQSGGRFSYGNLLEKSELPTQSPIRNVFQVLDTKDFEEVVGALEYAAKVESAYNDQEKRALFESNAQTLREALIHAIRSVHPEIIFELPDEQVAACIAFLRNFNNYYTLNYDLLLYWVNLKSDPHLFSDGFGRGEQQGGFRRFSSLGNCNLYNLHGGLHLFPCDDGETKKRIVVQGNIIGEITRTIERGRVLPTFVAEGSSTKKLAKIRSIPYLNHCYGKLEDQAGNIFVFGHSASEFDTHIYDAIYSGNVDHVFLCMRDPRNLRQLCESMAKYAVRHPRIRTSYIDVSTFNVWGNPATGQ